MNSNKVKPSRRELSFNSSIQPWVDKRRCTTDGLILSSKTSFTKDAKCYRFCSRTPKLPSTEMSALSLSSLITVWKVSANFINTSLKSVLIPMKILNLPSRTSRLMLNSKESIHGSSGQLPFCLSTPRLTFKSHSGDSNTT